LIAARWWGDSRRKKKKVNGGEGEDQHVMEEHRSRRQKVSSFKTRGGNTPKVSRRVGSVMIMKKELAGRPKGEVGEKSH